MCSTDPVGANAGVAVILQGDGRTPASFPIGPGDCAERVPHRNAASSSPVPTLGRHARSGRLRPGPGRRSPFGVAADRPVRPFPSACTVALRMVFDETEGQRGSFARRLAQDVPARVPSPEAGGGQRQQFVTLGQTKASGTCDDYRSKRWNVVTGPLATSSRSAERGWCWSNLSDLLRCPGRELVEPVLAPAGTREGDGEAEAKQQHRDHADDDPDPRLASLGRRRWNRRHRPGSGRNANRLTPRRVCRRRKTGTGPESHGAPRRLLWRRRRR